MDNHDSEFQKATALLKGVRLSASEKHAMLNHIYTEAEPLATPSPFVFASFFQTHRYASAFAVMILLFTGTAYASGESLPGDPLYAFKVHVIEPAALALRFTEAAKNEYRVAILQERIEEIQHLKTEGRLSFETETESSLAAQANLEEIESSAIFTATGTNLEVSGHVETYNALVEEAHRLKTIIQTGLEEADKKGKETNEEELPAEKPIKKITDDVEDVVDTAATVRDPIVEEVKEIVDPIVPTIKNIEL